MERKKEITTVDPGGVESLSVVGDTYKILISGEKTDGEYAVIDMLVPPGGGPGPHSHRDMQEMFYLVEGEIEFRMKNKIYTARKGAFVNIPLGGEVHSFKNNSGDMAHMVCTVVPAGLENFFQRIGVPVAEGEFSPPPELSKEDSERLRSIAETYGQKLYPPDFFGS